MWLSTDNTVIAGRPYVTLTYAQSLDGSIATADKRPIALSGHESREMTHWYAQILRVSFTCPGAARVCCSVSIPFFLYITLISPTTYCSLRAMHDGILVGVGTVLADDPKLTGVGLRERESDCVYGCASNCGCVTKRECECEEVVLSWWLSECACEGVPV